MRKKERRGQQRSFWASRSRKTQSGTSLVEFGLLAPIVIVILVGIVDFGRILMLQHVITNAAREEARIASLGGTTSEVQQKIQWYLTNSGLVTSNASITISGASVSTATGTPSIVTISYPVDSVVLRLIQSESTFTLTSTSRMLHE